MSARVFLFPRGRRRSAATIEKAWREACIAYLFACFNGAPSEELRTLAAAAFFARLALQKRQSGQVASVPRPRPGADSRAHKIAVKSPLSTLSTGRNR